MILPTALVDRWPGEAYKTQHATIESALKHNVQDALNAYYDLKLFKEIEKYISKIPEPELPPLNKDQRIALKRLGGPGSFREQLSQAIIQKDENLTRLMKYSDYPAMVMAAYPSSQFIDKSRYRSEYNTI